MAMGYLGELKYPPGAAPIVERLGTDPGPAARALVAYGAVAEKALDEKLAANDAKVRLAILGVLKQTATLESLPLVQAAAKDADLGVALAAREVWRRVDPKGLTPMDEALMDLGGGSKEFIARGLAAIKAMPVEDARRDEVAKRLWGLLGTGGADAEVQNGACDALMTWADDSVKDLALAALRPDGGEDAKRPYAIRLLVHFKDIRAVKPLCDALAQNRNVPEVSAALAEFGPASEEFLIKMLASGDGGQQTNACEVLREAGTRRCFRALQAIANPKGGGDERMKKLAAQTIIDINRRLNSAAAREAAGGATSQPATGTTRPSTLPRPTTRATGPSLW
jgi:HEAT repeat protein